MRLGTWITIGVLVLALVGIGAVLVGEAMRGPTFRAEDHASLDECLRNIPAEWVEGSLERTGAEQACRYVHRAQAEPR